MFFLHFFAFALGENEIPFDITEYKDWRLLVSKTTGFDSNDYFQEEVIVSSYIMKANGSVMSDVSASKVIGKQLFHFNVTNSQIEMFNVKLDLIATLKMSKIDNDTIYISGGTPDNSCYVSGFVSTSNLIITAASTVTDEIILISSMSSKQITYWELMGRLSPAFCIVFFFGFGNLYKKRFWDQYSQMNTNTLKKRIDEAKKNE